MYGNEGKGYGRSTVDNEIDFAVTELDFMVRDGTLEAAVANQQVR